MSRLRLDDAPHGGDERKLRKQELSAWKDRLLEERQRLEVELEAAKQSTNATTRDSSGDLSGYSSHMADLGTDTMEREKAFLFAEQKRSRLAEVNDALARIENGRFGVCEACGQSIPPRRLERVPAARFCVSCQEKREKQRS